MTMTTKELLALVDRWRDQGLRHRECGPNGAMLAEVRERCADELAPIATALCAEVEALRKVRDAASNLLAAKPTYSIEYGRAEEALRAAMALEPASRGYLFASLSPDRLDSPVITVHDTSAKEPK